MIKSEIFRYNSARRRKIQNHSAKRTKIQYIQDFEIHTRFIKSTNNIFSILKQEVLGTDPIKFSQRLKCQKKERTKIICQQLTIASLVCNARSFQK